MLSLGREDTKLAEFTHPQFLASLRLCEILNAMLAREMICCPAAAIRGKLLQTPAIRLRHEWGAR
jgi:hypothetical protein